MRVAMVTESFLPQVNGVTTSVLRMCEYLQRRGHQVLIVAPGSGPTFWQGSPVLRVPSAPIPGYTSHRVGIPWVGMVPALRGFAPDLVHLASPAVLGVQAALVAESLHVPAVAVYQTDLAGYAARYRAPISSAAAWRWLRWVHGRAALTLAPSRHAVNELQRHGVPRVQLWPRGVDQALFRPGARDPALREGLLGGRKLLVGYVGRLAPEKRLGLLAAARAVPEVQLVIVGDGPQRSALERELSGAHFLGQLDGEDLAALYASLDVFVHTGPHETFCQAAQEALASGVPVVAPAAGGLLDLVEDGVNGLLYAPDRAADLVEALRGLVDPQRRGPMALAARASVTDRSWDRVGDDYLRMCRELLAPRHLRSVAA